ncbi:uncharacterized protein LOC111257078 [Setaria italica]|uniref:uncharacterized protein LOC111257078 n=1 Tax=Setaria italica TaxID=4555 RepID=UPI000BE4CC80|nr:uncharacterized protein LOC111257078 [Setaria italica]
MPITCPKADRVLDFLDELVHRYGFPNHIIIDLSSNFNNHEFWEYCENSGIDILYVSVTHPQANDQVKRTNGMVLDALKKRLHDIRNMKGVYGSEAILPANIMWKSPTVEQYDEGTAEQTRRLDIDSLEEARYVALVQSARYLEGLPCYHDRNIKEQSFNIDDMVLRRIQDSKGVQQLYSPWEGPFIISKVNGPGSY